MSTVPFESVTQTTSPNQPHSLNIIVPANQINNLTNHSKHGLSISSPSNKCSFYPMHSSLQTPPPTPRRPDGFIIDRHQQNQQTQTRRYPTHLLFHPPCRLANPDSQGNYTRIEEKLKEYSSDFADVPVDYVRSSIRRRGKKLYDIARFSTLQRSGSQIVSKQLDPDCEAMPPTHVLVLLPLTPSPALAPEFHPIHSLVPTLYCANFPPFPQSDNSSTLPQLPIRLPHPPSFKLLVHFLYTRQIQNIISYLLPVPWSSRRQHDYISHPTTLPVPISLSALMNLVRSTLASLSSEDQWDHIDLLYGVYLNIVALGMYDLPLHGSRDGDYSDSSTSGRQSVNDPNKGERHPGIERLNPEWGSIVIQNGTRDVDGRLLCICLIAMWEGICRT